MKISASDSAEIVKGEKILAEIDLVISSVTGMYVRWPLRT